MFELKKAILINKKDNVSTALLSVEKGDTVTIIYNDKTITTISALDNIERYHKIAIVDIQIGDEIYKYGEVIGRAIKPIKKGNHVHLDNIEGVMDNIENKWI